MALFKKKSTSVDAINYQGQLIPLMQWLQATNIENHPEVSMRIEDTGAIHISNSLQSTSSVAHIGDWIVCSRVGCWYAISKDVFSKFYENVKEETCQ